MRFMHQFLAWKLLTYQKYLLKGTTGTHSYNFLAIQLQMFQQLLLCHKCGFTSSTHNLRTNFNVPVFFCICDLFLTLKAVQLCVVKVFLFYFSELCQTMSTLGTLLLYTRSAKQDFTVTALFWLQYALFARKAE